MIFGSSLRKLFLLCVVTLAPLPLQAQEPAARGVVIDSASGAPIVGAEVRLRGTGYFGVTDARGQFRVRTEGSAPFLDVYMLGYEPAAVSAGTSDNTLMIRLRANPILLKALEVTASRLASRRRAYSGSARALEQDVLARLQNQNVHEVLYQRLVHMRACSSRGGAGDRFCVFRRGRLIMPSVYVDEAPVIGGMELLRAIPIEQIHTLESYDGGTRIRVYTKWYVEKLARNAVRLMPIIQ